MRLHRKKPLSRKKTTWKRASKIVGVVRYFIAVLLVLGIAVVLPLLVVWKQAFITGLSMRRDQLVDSLTVLQHEAVQLDAMARRLAGTGRIERIARESLGLDYPRSKKIVVVHPEQSPPQHAGLNSPFWALLCRSLVREKG